MFGGRVTGHEMALGRRRRTAVVLLLLVLASAAGVVYWVLPAREESLDARGGSVPVEPRWVSDGWIYYVPLAADGETDKGALWRTRPGGRSESVDINFPNCGGDEVDSFFVISDGRLGITKSCANSDPGFRSFFAYDAGSGRVELLAAVNLGGAGIATWNSGDRVGYSDFDKCDSRLARITPDGYTCISDVYGTQLTLANNGRVLLYFAHACARSADAPATRDASWWLCRWDLSSGSITRVVGGFSSPKGLDVDTQSRVAAIAGTRNGADGLWLVDLSKGTAVEVASGNFGSPSLSPDGRRIVATKSTSFWFFTSYSLVVVRL